MLVIHNSNIFIDTSIRLDSVPVSHCLVLNGVRPQLQLPVSSTLHGSAEWHWVRRKRQPLKRVPMRMLVPVPLLACLVPEPIDFKYRATNAPMSGEGLHGCLHSRTWMTKRLTELRLSNDFVCEEGLLQLVLVGLYLVFTWSSFGFH